MRTKAEREAFRRYSAARITAVAALNELRASARDLGYEPLSDQLTHCPRCGAAVVMESVYLHEAFHDGAEQ